MKERLFIEKSKEEVDIEEFIRSELKNTKCGSIEIQTTPLMTRIIVYTTTPSLVIGSGGQRIKEISEKLKDKFSIENPQIDIQKIDNQFKDAKVVATSIAIQIESGINYKRLGNFYVERVMEFGAIGCEIIITGKMMGERSRRERFNAGYIKKCGNTAKTDVDTAYVVATPRLGNIGIWVKIANKPPVHLVKAFRKYIKKEEDIKQQNMEQEQAEADVEKSKKNSEKESNTQKDEGEDNNGDNKEGQAKGNEK